MKETRRSDYFKHFVLSEQALCILLEFLREVIPPLMKSDKEEDKERGTELFAILSLLNIQCVTDIAKPTSELTNEDPH